MYEYDDNGNLDYESAKEIDFTYNLLNLPKEANFGSNKKIHYFYTFNGEKLRQSVENNGTITKVDYCGPFVYETVSGVRSLKYFITPEGRAVKSGTTWDYEYNLKDYLGNTRVVINDSSGVARVIQQRHYYPFGMEMSELSTGTSTNKYLYNDKEYQNAFDLDWYDFGARFYDPQIGRWHSVDPLCEVNRRWSPYRYAYDNPMRFIDPDGMIETVKPTSEEALRVLQNTLAVNDAKYVQKDRNGEVDKTLINSHNSNSGNFNDLKTLVNSKTEYKVEVSSEYQIGDKRQPLVGDNENGTKGVTLMPGAENDPSPDNSVHIITSSKLSEERKVTNLAEEAFGHALFYELKQQGQNVNPNHQYEGVYIEIKGKDGSVVDWVIGREDKNSLLHEHIKERRAEAQDNLKKR